MPAGRPRSFAEDDVLDIAVGLFLRHGYEGVGIAAICKEAGLSSQSLYNTFGDKAELYRRAMARYGQTANVPMIEALKDTADPLDALRGFVDGWRHHASGCDAAGCLFARAMASAGAESPVDGEIARAFSLRLRTALRARCRDAAAQGLLPDGAMPDALGDTLLALSCGVAVLGRGKMPPVMVRNAMAQAMALLGG